jgi:cell division septation protein DedD
MGRKSIGVVALVLSALLIVGCSHEGADWKAASTADTSEAYQKFLTQYPKSPNAPQAQARIQQLQDDRDWQVATTTDSRDGYQQYLAQHPDSQNAQEARIRLENFAQSGAAAVAAASAAAATAAAAKPAAATARGKSHVAGAGIGAHYVQLGAFSSQARAESQWKRLSSRYSRELGALTPRYVASKSHSRGLVRLQVAVNSRAQGRALCEKLRAHAQSCVTVSAG